MFIPTYFDFLEVDTHFTAPPPSRPQSCCVICGTPVKLETTPWNPDCDNCCCTELVLSSLHAVHESVILIDREPRRINDTSIQGELDRPHGSLRHFVVTVE